ncbi:MAG: GNAT family acetyltransferase [Rhodoferax sp.]|jgi:ribosomal protein S18 acetylase RimI-like enzyme|uniref:GNAT family acetyltransferase n=1 Tax=Rhodoferax sp. TaxID=50421 RepID=UPI001B5B8EAB|nr:GNAT family acetyltransferase [Rhodoferax sp.]MBP8285310.1 GNAT family acetyltransferase [Rhodoferax sp.]MBP9150430.1 GNAT family acetyltransferase [Rhodoferax sp.]MBP9734044.1 GNAT family acetyltransferase [Rhodoferax sp.]
MPEIRQYHDPSDRESVIALWQTAFGYETAHNDPALAIARKLAVADGLFFVASPADKVVGTVMAGYDGHRGWLYSVAVHPDQRGTGLGSRLVQHAEAALVQLGCLKVNLQLVASNAATAAFYQSLGFAIEPRVSMGKVLYHKVPPQESGEQQGDQ